MTEPSDILWKNLVSGGNGLYMYRRFFLNILCIIILVFVSSPLSIFMNLKQYDNDHYLDFNWTGKSFIG